MMSELLETLELRNNQVQETTDEDRDEGGEDNPILHAESGPNRFRVMSLFFTDSDGVKVEEDLDLNLITVYYFNDEQTIELTEGAVYDWALQFYEGDDN